MLKLDTSEVKRFYVAASQYCRDRIKEEVFYPYFMDEIKIEDKDLVQVGDIDYDTPLTKYGMYYKNGDRVIELHKICTDKIKIPVSQLAVDARDTLDKTIIADLAVELDSAFIKKCEAVCKIAPVTSDYKVLVNTTTQVEGNLATLKDRVIPHNILWAFPKDKKVGTVVILMDVNVWARVTGEDVEMYGYMVCGMEVTSKDIIKSKVE
jgi:hypothetical protein